MPCRMRCRLLPSRSVSLDTLSCLWRSIARVSAAAGDWGTMNILLRRRGSSSFTKAGREPMAASCCGLRAARSEAGSNKDSGVSCKQPGRGGKGRGRSGSGALHETAKEEEARRRPRLHEAWLGAAATGCRRGQGTDRARTPLASRYYATASDCDTT